MMSGDPQFLSDLGWAYYFIGSIEAANNAFRRSLALDEDNPDAWRGLGWVLARCGESGGPLRRTHGRSRRTDSLLRAPLQEAHRGRAWAYLGEEQFERAHVDFSAAAALTPASDVGSLQDLNRGLGWLALKQDRAGDAQLYFSTPFARSAIGEGQNTTMRWPVSPRLTRRPLHPRPLGARPVPGVRGLARRQPAVI